MKPWNDNPSGWDSLANFAGTIPDKSLLVLLARTRDSDILDQSNFECALTELGGESESVQIIRHGHWACGWIEYLMIDSADKDMVTLGEDIETRLKNYPILDEDDYSNRQWEAASDYWASESVAERVRIIQEYGKPYVSVFAARRAELPQNDTGGIFDHCVA